jgi:hypothetical protein
MTKLPNTALEASSNYRLSEPIFDIKEVSPEYLPKFGYRLGFCPVEAIAD